MADRFLRKKFLPTLFPGYGLRFTRLSKFGGFIRLNKSFGPFVYQGRPILLEREQREIYCDNFCHVTSQVSAMLEHESEPKPLKIFSPKRSAKQNQIPTFIFSSILAFIFWWQNKSTNKAEICLFASLVVIKKSMIKLRECSGSFEDVHIE